MKWPTRAPEPALVRSVLVTITAVVAWLLGREVSTEWVDTIIQVYILASALVAGMAIRPAVTPVLGPPGRHARPEGE